MKLYTPRNMFVALLATFIYAGLTIAGMGQTITVSWANQPEAKKKISIVWKPNPPGSKTPGGGGWYAVNRDYGQKRTIQALVEIWDRGDHNAPRRNKLVTVSGGQEKFLFGEASRSNIQVSVKKARFR